MAVTFTKAPTVNVGDPITSAQMRALANAFNDRLRSGIGDGAWRIAMFWFNLFRQVRNPDATGFVFPSQGEFFELYQLLDPEQGAAQWPETGPGDFEGANLANPMMQYVFGVGSLEGDAARVSDPNVVLWLTDHPPVSLEEKWAVGKYQRGVIDPISGLQNVPAISAARSYQQIVQPYYSHHGKSYGGYFPSPIVLLDDCGDDDTNGLGIPSRELKWTALSATASTVGFHGSISSVGGFPVVTYAGSCPLDTLLSAVGHVVGTAIYPDATYVWVNNGAGGYNIDVFPSNEWLEGPYEGDATLDFKNGGQLSRAVWSFAVDFRGTPSQRVPDDFDIQKLAFAFQEFGTRQYYLAPNIAEVQGDSLLPLYPQATLSGPGTVNDGTFLTFPSWGGTTHSYALGYVLSGCVAVAKDILETITIEVLDGPNVVATLRLEPDASHNAEAMYWFPNPKTPNPLSVRLAGAAKFRSADGKITFEATEQYPMKPQFWDAALVLRLSATAGGDPFQGGVDGGGYTSDNVPQYFKNYTDFGCIFNGLADAARDQGDWVNDNPGYDSVRRLSREHMRIIRRQQLVSYAVTGGKTIMKFKRYSFGLDTQKADCFYGIAPSYDYLVTGDVMEGETYIVRGKESGAKITYQGADYLPGQTFTATTVKDFQFTADARLFVKDGIRAEAIKKGWSNEWVMSLETKCYHPSFSSVWKSDAYSDYFTWNNRCLFYGGSVTNRNFRRHIGYNYGTAVTERDDGNGWDNQLLPPAVQVNLIVTEAPSGYNYAQNSNFSGESDQFRKSCQIYKAPYELESATSAEEGGEEIVTLTFKGLFQRHEDAPAIVDANPITWSGGEVFNLHSEDYRTCDNAIREYVHHQATHQQCTFKTGDSGTSSAVTGLPDNPFGSCYPHFIFTRLIRKPYQDDNNTLQSWDTRATIDEMLHCEVALRAICEGFVDGITSEEITCKTGQGAIYDYSFENLMRDSDHNRWMGPFTREERPDNPAGHGPQPNTFMRAAHYNRISGAVNLLTRARMMLPFSVECKLTNFEGSRPLSGGWPTGTTCSSGVTKIVIGTSPPGLSGVASAFDWDDCGLEFSSEWTAGIANTCDGSGNFVVVSHLAQRQYRVKMDDTTLLSVPILFRDQIQSLGGFLAYRIIQKDKPVATKVFTSAESTGIPVSTTGFFWDSGTGEGYSLDIATAENATTCVIIDAGTLSAAAPPSGPFWFGRNAGSQEYGGGSVSRDILQVQTDPGFYISIPLVEPNEI